MLNSNHHYRRALLALGTAAGFALLSGCQGHKIVAKINGSPIDEAEYTAYVSRVKANDFQAFTQLGVTTDAGGVGLVTIIKERLLDKLAAEKGVRPTDEQVNRYADYLKRTNASVAQALSSGQVGKDDLPRLIRDQMILLAIGSDNATVPEDDIKKEFTANKQQYDYPELDGIRAVAVPDEAKGIELINKIKATGDFGTEALQYNPQAGIVRFIPGAQLPKPLQDALLTLKDGQLAPAPISLSNSSQPAAPATFIVLQLVQRMPKGEAKLEDAHEAIRQRKLQETHQEILKHSQDVMGDFNKKAQVEVFIDKYKDIVKAALTPPPPAPMSVPPPSASMRPGPTTIRPSGPSAPSAGTLKQVPTAPTKPSTETPKPETPKPSTKP